MIYRLKTFLNTILYILCKKHLMGSLVSKPLSFTPSYRTVRNMRCDVGGKVTSTRVVVGAKFAKEFFIGYFSYLTCMFYLKVGV